MAEYMTVTEIAKELRVSRMTVYRMCDSGELPSIRVGRSVRIREHDVIELIKRRGAKVEPEVTEEVAKMFYMAGLGKGRQFPNCTPEIEWASLWERYQKMQEGK